MEKDRVEIICKIYFLKMFLHFLHSLQSIFWRNTRMWDLLGQQEWSHELGGVKGKDPAVRMDRAGHILEKSFQENCILLDMPGWRSLEKRIAVDAESQIPSAQNCRSSLLAWGDTTPKHSGICQDSRTLLIAHLSLQSLKQSAFGVSLTYQLSLNLSAFTKIWSCDVYSHHSVGGGRSAVKIFQQFPLCSFWTKALDAAAQLSSGLWVGEEGQLRACVPAGITFKP